MEQIVENNESCQNVEMQKFNMEDIVKNIKNVKKYKVGQLVKANIINVDNEGIVVSILSFKADYFTITNDDLLYQYTKDDIGKEIRLMITDVTNLKFSEKSLKNLFDLEKEIEELKKQESFIVNVVKTNVNGLICSYNKLNIFVPKTQLEVKPNDNIDLEKYVGQELEICVYTVQQKDKYYNIIGSHKKILVNNINKNKKILKTFLNQHKEGDIVKGTVVGYDENGVKVCVSSLHCFVFNSDVSYEIDFDKTKILELDKEYDFKIIKLDIKNKKIVLGFKQLIENPYLKKIQEYKIGDVFNVKVRKLYKYFVLVEIEQNILGYINISQLSTKYVNEVSDVVAVDDTFDASIIEIKGNKIFLSVKALEVLKNKQKFEAEQHKKREAKKIIKKTNQSTASIFEILHIEDKK